jgi:hypothetical protein
MKNMTILLILLMPFLLLAQNKDENSATGISSEAAVWMNKISSDSEMRVKMINMMIEKTTGNKEEMLKLVDAMLTNTAMHEMIISESKTRTRDGDISVEPRGMTNGVVKEKEMSGVKTVPRKK